MKKINLIKISIILTDIFISLIFVLALLLPTLVTIYVERANRLESLATTIMVTCYPCAPFTMLGLWFLRKTLKNVLNKDFLCDQNIKCLKYMSICFVIIAVITVIAGRYYLPFYIVAATFLFLSLIVFIFRSILSELKNQNL